MTPTCLNTITPLLNQLFSQASSVHSPLLASLSNEERDRLMRSKTGYREMYGRIKEMWLPVSRQTGELLYLLARACQASTIIEYGSSYGISTLYLAAALRDNGGGVLIGSEFESEKVAGARLHLQQAGLSDLVEIREGDALQSLRDNLPKSIDLVLLDGAKSLYKDILDLLESRLHVGSLIIADNVDYCPDYLEHIRQADGDYLSLPFADDVEVSLRLR